VTKKPVIQAYAEYLLFRLAGMVLLSTSVERSLRWARALGSLFYRVVRRHRETALGNLRMAFGDEWDEAKIQQVARAAFQHFAMIAFEVVWMPRLVRRSTCRRYVGTEECAILLGAMSAPRPLIILTGHLGNWELMGYTVTLLGHRLHSIARPLDNWLLDRYLVNQREAQGQRIIPRKGALRQLIRAGRENANIAFLVDQNERRGGVFVDFFGRPASTVRSVAALALRMRARILVAFGIREGTGFRYRLVEAGEISAEPTGDREADIYRITNDFTKRIEEFVRRYPDQWLWFHRRWKTRPPGEVS